MTSETETAFRLAQTSHRPPVDYDRPPTYGKMIAEKDVYVPMRDGVKLCVDVYRPDTDREAPRAARLRDLQQGPARDRTWPRRCRRSRPGRCCGPARAEAGDTRFLVSRGYVHVIGNPRGVGKSEGGGSREWDSYDLIEWIAEQPWCDGNVGMIGISGFGAEQLHAAKQQPPHLKAIFPFDPRGAYGEAGRLPRRVSGRRAPPVPLSARSFRRRRISTRAQPGNAAARAREALARGDDQSGLPDVSAHLQRADAEGAAHAGLFRAC